MVDDIQQCLILDDSPIIRRYARLIFENLGFRVSEAETASSAIAAIVADPPDLLLVDWQIPGLSTFEFIKSVRSKPLQKQPYLIYVTTENNADDLARAFHAGADDYLQRPFNTEIILSKLQEIRVAA